MAGKGAALPSIREIPSLHPWRRLAVICAFPGRWGLFANPLAWIDIGAPGPRPSDRAINIGFTCYTLEFDNLPLSDQLRIIWSGGLRRTDEILQHFKDYRGYEVIYGGHKSLHFHFIFDGTSRGTFSLRSPARPNPIGTAIAHLVGIEGAIVMVRGLDCLDGTPLLDLKPDRGLFTPIAPPQPGDFQVGDP
jgi:hypothetical protein